MDNETEYARKGVLKKLRKKISIIFMIVQVVTFMLVISSVFATPSASSNLFMNSKYIANNSQVNPTTLTFTTISNGLDVSDLNDATNKDYSNTTWTFELTAVTDIKTLKLYSSGTGGYIRFMNSTGVQVGGLQNFAVTNASYITVNYVGVKYVEVYANGIVGTLYADDGNVPPPDTTAPDIPASFTAVQGTEQGGIYLSWSASNAPDTKEYYLFQHGVQIATLSKTVTNYNVIGLQDSTTYDFQISVSDITGNVSALSSSVSATTKPPPPPPPDTVAPPVPTGLQGTAGDKTASLNWLAITGVPDLAGYNVYRSGTKQNSSVITGTTFTQSALANNTTYSYQITSVDTSGNESAKSTALDLKPSGIMTVTYTPNGTTIIVRVDGGLAPYTVDANNQSTIFNSNTYYVSGLTKSTDYAVTVTDTNGQTFTQTLNTGSTVGYLPPVMPDSTSLFQDMLNSFGTAGTIGLAVIGGAVSLGILVILAIWGWRLLKRWLATSK